MHVKNIKKAIIGVLFAVLLPTCGWSQIIETDDPMMPNIIPTNDTLMKHINELCSGEYRGRLAGDEGYMKATQYIINELRSYGVKPFQGSWLQDFAIERNRIEACSFQVQSMRDNSFRTLVIGSDFVCAGKTGNGFTAGQAVFCGYGVEENDFNEYAGMDLTDRIAVVLSGAPKFLPTNIANKYITIKEKARVAQRHGANAIVVINLDTTCRPDEVQAHVYSGDGAHLATFPMLLTTRLCGTQLLEPEPHGLAEVISAIESTKRPQSFIMDQRFEIKAYADYNAKAPTANVVGIMPGESRPENREYIVVGAHLDHVGMQGESSMFPGADDNASGVAAVLEVARMLTMCPIPPQRNVIFAFFAGAENEHEGALMFLKKFKKIQYVEAFINAESIGSGDSIMVLGDEVFPLLYGIADSADKDYTQSMVHTFATKPDGDATIFTEIGIPSLVVTTYNGHKHNHVLEDIPEVIDIDMVNRCTKLIFQTVYQLSDGVYRGRSLRSRAFRFR